MNFLAHAYLSFNNKEILIGNLISDFIKGREQYTFSPAIQKGIALHRKIDLFTDCHPATLKAKEVFKPDYRLYSGVITDIIYDHFLATDNVLFPKGSLYLFTQNVYATLEAYTAQLPLQFIPVLAYMKKENWLYNYKFNEGMEKSIRGMVRRSAFLTDSQTAYNLFIKHYQLLQECYNEFFTDIRLYAQQELNQIVL